MLLNGGQCTYGPEPSPWSTFLEPKAIKNPHQGLFSFILDLPGLGEFDPKSDGLGRQRPGEYLSPCRWITAP
jgi:hypothetical protein